MSQPAASAAVTLVTAIAAPPGGETPPATRETEMTIKPAHADRILANETLCRSIRAIAATGEHSLRDMADCLRAGAARRKMPMTAGEALGLVDAILGDDARELHRDAFGAAA